MKRTFSRIWFGRLLKKGTACFDKLSMSGRFLIISISSPFVLSLSKDVPRVFQQPASALVLLMLAAGCVGIEKSYPDKRYFVLEVNRSVNSSNTAGNGILQIANIRVSPRYEDKGFVYRTSGASYESDFYNQFLVSPAALLGEELRKGLAQVQIFRHVINSSSQLEPTHVLEGVVDALYGDFRDPGAPKAVLEMEFFLRKESPSKAEILAAKRYAQSVAVNGRSPEALVKGWNEALNDIVASLTADLKALQAKF